MLLQRPPWINTVFDDTTQSFGLGFEKPAFMTDLLSKAVSLREVHLHFDFDRNVNQCHMGPFITQ